MLLYIHPCPYESNSHSSEHSTQISNHCILYLLASLATETVLFCCIYGLFIQTAFFQLIYCNFCKNRGLGKCFVFDKSKNIFFYLFFFNRYLKNPKSKKLQYFFVGFVSIHRPKVLANARSAKRDLTQFIILSHTTKKIRFF